jgi:hypothetical protein
MAGISETHTYHQTIHTSQRNPTTSHPPHTRMPTDIHSDGWQTAAEVQSNISGTTSSYPENRISVLINRGQTIMWRICKINAQQTSHNEKLGYIHPVRQQKYMTKPEWKINIKQQSMTSGGELGLTESSKIYKENDFIIFCILLQT